MNILLHLMLLHGCILRPNQNHFGILHILHLILIFYFDETAVFFFNVLSNTFYCRTAASTTHCKHTFDALFTQDLFRTQANCFTRTLAVGIQCLAQCSKPERPGREREQEKERERENRTGKKGEGQFELEFGQSSNVFSGCLHGLIKSTPLAQGLVATRGGLWCLCHGFPAGQPPQPHSPPPTATHLMLTRCCDRKPVNKGKSCCFF